MANDAKRTNAREQASRVSAALRCAKGLVSRERIFRRVQSELSALSDMELNELGLSRKMIRSVARQAAGAA